MSASSQVPTTVFTGFLGSGKTTVISYLIKYLRDQGKEVVYIKNEIGESDLDASLMRGENILSREILGGCICCTLVGPFTSAIDEIVATYKPDRIIIESSGTADPSAMALMVSDHPLLERDGVISIVDVLNFEGYQDLTPIAKRQAEMTDLIVLNKIELADLSQKRRVVGYIRELNEKSPVVEAPEGKLSPELAFGLSVGELDEQLREEIHEDSHDHQIEDQINALTLSVEKEFEQQELEAIISSLPRNIFRVKGIVKIKNLGFQVLNAVFSRTSFSPLPENYQVEAGRLIFIGHQVQHAKENLENILT